MITRSGIPVSHGVTIGTAFVLGAEEFRIPRHCVGDAGEEAIIEQEFGRFTAAVDAVVEQIRANEATIRERVGDALGAIFTAHAQLANDPRFRAEVESAIRDQHFSPEYAVTTTLGRLADQFRSLDQPYLKDRVTDVVDLEKRLLRELLGTRHQEMTQLNEPVVLLAHDLTPSETAGLPREHRPFKRYTQRGT